MKKAAEISIGENKSKLACFEDCEATFDLNVLQRAIRPEMFSKWVKKAQVAEIDDANLENREDCPFCPYVVIMESLPEENKIFQCLNPDCSIESCRLCRQKSHLPLRCGELENLGTRKRTYIEENMSEALIRYCWQCKKPFIKNSGCNNVRCSCGASNCYVCQQPVLNGYAHFSRGNAAQEPGKCPMVSVCVYLFRFLTLSYLKVRARQKTFRFGYLFPTECVDVYFSWSFLFDLFEGS